MIDSIQELTLLQQLGCQTDLTSINSDAQQALDQMSSDLGLDALAAAGNLSATRFEQQLHQQDLQTGTNYRGAAMNRIHRQVNAAHQNGWDSILPTDQSIVF